MGRKTFVIDPGHFASTPGKESPDGKIKEYAWNYEMAERLAKALSKAGHDVRMTITKAQSDSTTLKDYLTNRAALANKICLPVSQGGEGKAKSDVVFVSVHINAASNGGWSNARGWSVFVSANSSGKITASPNSKKLAECLFDAIEKQGFMMRKPAPSQKYWPGNFTVLTKTSMPAVLMENLFMDNKADAELLLSEDAKQKLLAGWFNGLMKYIGEEGTEMPKECTCTCKCCQEHCR